MIRVCVPFVCLMLLATACSTAPRHRVVHFTEQDAANLIVRYYTDDTSYLLKPARTDGPFLTVLDKEAVVEVAKQQPSRQLAVVILIRYAAESQAEAVKQKWKNLLTQAGYQRVVFLGGQNTTRVNGLAVLPSGG